MVHSRYRKALAILNDNSYRHHDAQQCQPAGVHTAPLLKVTLGIKIEICDSGHYPRNSLSKHLILIIKYLYTPGHLC